MKTMRCLIAALGLLMESMVCGQMYDPESPFPTESDINSAEHSAFEHGSRAADAMSDRDSWRSIREQELANKAQRDAEEMRMRMEKNERDKRRAYEDQAEQNGNLVANHTNGEDEFAKLTPQQRFEMLVKLLQPAPYLGGVNASGWCYMCGARLLGVFTLCARCQSRPPKKYTDWERTERLKAERLKVLLANPPIVVQHQPPKEVPFVYPQVLEESMEPSPTRYSTKSRYIAAYIKYKMTGKKYSSYAKKSQAKSKYFKEAEVRWSQGRK